MDFDHADTVAVVTGALERLSHLIASRDVDTTLASFSAQPDIVLVGSESGYAAKAESR